MKYIVYCTTCLVNNKIYIGVHKTENPEVFDGYIGNGIGKKNIATVLRNPTTAFQYAVEKYGYKNFKRATLFVFDTEEEAYAKEAEIVNLEFVKRRDTYNTSLGGYGGTTYDPIYQYDLDGNFIKKWDGTCFAVKHYNCNPSRFLMAIRDKRSAFESYWTKEYVDHLDVSDHKKSIRSEIYQFDINGNLIKTWDSVNQIVSEAKLSRASVDEAIQKSKMFKDCYWIKNKNDLWNIIKSDIDNKQKKPISRYKPSGELIKTYINITICCKEIGCNRNKIKSAILSGDLYEGSLWSYYTEPTYKKYSPSALDKGYKVGAYDLDGNLVKIYNTVTECAKEHPKCREVLKGFRNKTHNLVFKYITD